ncbi:MAG: PIN domain-containing protein [Chloroflexi bacterium]|nr:PIN domain-containing protein [Chloroflexota bacterium]
MTLPDTLRDRAVFVDTSAFLADLDRSDQWHAEAHRGFLALAQEGRFLITTNLVAAETYALVAGRMGRPLARRWLDSLALPLVYETLRDRAEVLKLLDQHRDRALSYVDSFSFLTLKRLGVSVAFAFDEDFRAGDWALYQPPLV